MPLVNSASSAAPAGRPKNPFLTSPHSLLEKSSLSLKACLKGGASAWHFQTWAERNLWLFCFCLILSRDRTFFYFECRARVMQSGELKLMLITCTFRRNVKTIGWRGGRHENCQKANKHGTWMVAQKSQRVPGDASNGCEGSELSGHPTPRHLPGVTKLNPCCLSSGLVESQKGEGVLLSSDRSRLPSVLIWHGAKPYRKASWWLLRALAFYLIIRKTKARRCW